MVRISFVANTMVIHHGTDLTCGKYYGMSIVVGISCVTITVICTLWYGSYVRQILWYVHHGTDLMWDKYCGMYIVVRISCVINTVVCTSWYGSRVWQILWYVQHSMNLMRGKCCRMCSMVRISCRANTYGIAQLRSTPCLSCVENIIVCTKWHGFHVWQILW